MLDLKLLCLFAFDKLSYNFHWNYIFFFIFLRSGGLAVNSWKQLMSQQRQVKLSKDQAIKTTRQRLFEE